MILRSVLMTLAYSDVFSFPLTVDEVTQRLVFHKASRGEVQKSLAELLSLGLLEQQADLWCLQGRTELFELRAERAKTSQKLWNATRQPIQLLQRIPWISHIYVTGSLAVNNSTAASDIDFMIVTRPHTLWLCRLIVGVLSELYGKRRKWKKSWHEEEPGKWCFNIWVTANNLEIFARQQTLYHAYEVLQASQVYGENDILRMKNTWISQFLPNFGLDLGELKVGKTGQAISLIDLLLYKLQRIYMRNHHTSEQVTREYALFHPRPTDQLVLRQLEERFK